MIAQHLDWMLANLATQFSSKIDNRASPNQIKASLGCQFFSRVLIIRNLKIGEEEGGLNKRNFLTAKLD